MTDTEIMESLIAYTYERALDNKTFTGTFILRDNKIIQKSITSIEKDQNPLAHAELKAIDAAIKQYGPDLAGYQLFTTQRPCPMCASAMIWAGIERVVYGYAASDYQWETFGNIHRFFTEHKIECMGPFLEEECKAIDDFLVANGI